MKFQFKEQDYQVRAVESIADVFAGQPFEDRASYLREAGDRSKGQMGIRYSGNDAFLTDDTGFANARLALSGTQLLQNIRNVQQNNNIRQSEELKGHLGACSLDVEMETGTGKTYVYIRTMFELNKRYGWSKFIIVVPSVAIREGVANSFDLTEEHFFGIYGKKIRRFVYNSKDLGQLDDFAADKDIYCMIINAQAFAASLKEGARNEAARIIYSLQDTFSTRRPIDVIAATRPIIILDEPQKLGGAATQASLQRFRPLFTVNFSATHKEAHNLVYVLDALDAYNMKLVKQIEVKGLEIKNLRGTDGFVCLNQIMVSAGKPPVARLSFEVNRAGGVSRETRLCGVGYDLYKNSAGKGMSSLERYREGYVVKDIDAAADSVTFMNGLVLHSGEGVGDMNEREMRRVQIRETIESHFEKEELLFSRGIKCLSLFFIDEVANYRRYGEDGSEKNGIYGDMFEQEYNSVLERYKNLPETPYIRYLKGISAHQTHRGYFSVDKNKRMVDPSKNKRSEESDDISAYDLILKDKERLLSFKEPVRFIFSHSALREGWDNPNIFQICTLKQSDSTVTKRQEVGRGMRLCVDETGKRQDDTFLHGAVFDVNRLTVVASESYKDFVSGLQRDIAQDLYERPARAASDYFFGKTVHIDGVLHQITSRQAEDIEYYLIKNDYIDRERRVTEKYRKDVSKGALAPLPESVQPFGEEVHALVGRIVDESALAAMTKNGRKSKIEDNDLNENFRKPEFQELWNRLNRKYAYSVHFDSEDLIRQSVRAIDEHLAVSRVQYTVEEGSQRENIRAEQVKAGESFKHGKARTKLLQNAGGTSAAYDLIGKICSGTGLTRKTISAVLKGIRADKFAMFRNDPEEFIAKAVRLINGVLSEMVAEHIEYTPTGGVYDNSIFTKGASPLAGAVKAERHITPYVICESDIEREFAEALDSHSDEVSVFAKLPKGFSIPTPVGNYTPDWVIAYKKEGEKKVRYIVAETKGSAEESSLRRIEKTKIACAKKFFSSLDDKDIIYSVVTDYAELFDVANA